MTSSPSTYRWARPGDVNAFFGLMLDNMSDLVIFASILILGFGVPKEVVLFKMVPGSAVAVLVGDLLYTWMAFGLARRERRSDVTAMPLGMDTPSTIGYAVAIYGPAYMMFTREGMAPEAAGERLWYLSMAVMVMSGLIKAAGSLVGERIRAAVPRAGLLGSIAAVALVLIAFLPSLKIFGSPIVGLLSLGIILAALIARYRLPWNVPGALAAVGVGMLVYYVLAALPFGLPGIEPFHGDFSLRFALPIPTLGFVQGLADAWLYFPIVLPFTLAIVVGSVDVTESAAAAGDTYPTRRIILADAAATALAGLCGGAVQSTPYIGHPAYKAMGGRAAYTLATALFIGAGGMLGYLAFFVDFIPEAAVAPILVFIGLEITAQAFEATPHRHAKAVAICFLPVMANLVSIQLDQMMQALGGSEEALTGEISHAYFVLRMLGNGFILSALLWGALSADLIDRRYARATGFALLGSVMCLFGLIHSPYPAGAMFWPWAVQDPHPFAFAAGYALLALACLGLGRVDEAKHPDEW
ncbi:MAG: MFS transporter [Acidobacteriota bacterium]|nr:MAG: MFS transporter [Acidobacteriota bacterium]